MEPTHPVQLLPGREIFLFKQSYQFRTCPGDPSLDALYADVEGNGGLWLRHADDGGQHQSFPQASVKATQLGVSRRSRAPEHCAPGSGVVDNIGPIFEPVCAK
jgi:hypothetical protein